MERRLDLERRNQKIYAMYSRGIHRKLIAVKMDMRYDAVRKVILQYTGPERMACLHPRRIMDSAMIMRQIECYDVKNHSYR